MWLNIGIYLYISSLVNVIIATPLCIFLHPCFSILQPTTAFCAIDVELDEGKIFPNYCEFGRHNKCYKTNYLPTSRRDCFTKYPYTRDQYAVLMKPMFELGPVNKNKKMPIE